MQVVRKVIYINFIDVLCDTHTPVRRIQMIQTIASGTVEWSFRSYVSLVDVLAIWRVR